MRRFAGALAIVVALASYAFAGLLTTGVGGGEGAGGGSPLTTTLDPSSVNRGAGMTLSNGNLTVTQTAGDGSHYQSAYGKAPYINGKYYFEATPSGTLGNFCLGLANGFNPPAGVTGNCGFFGFTSVVFYPGTVGLYTNSVSLGSTPIGVAGHVYGFAVDLTNGLMWMRDVTASSTTWNAGGSANPATGVGGYSITGVTLYCPCYPLFAINTTANAITANFGAIAFAAAAPTGFVAWPDNGSTPALANAVGYSNRNFNEPWASTATIDTSNSLAAGFNWYVNSTFPNLYANGSIYQGFITNAPVYPSGDYSVSGNLLALTLSASPSNWSSLSTCYWNGSAVLGNAFGGGFYADVSIKTSTAGGSYSGTGNPAWWFLPKEYLNGSITTLPFVELDGWESKFGMVTHDWNVQTGANNQYNAFSGTVSTYQDNVLHEFSVLWIPVSLSNQGKGSIARYLDGVLQATLLYSASTVPNPALTPSNPSGALSEMDSENFCMFLNVADHWPASFGAIQMWQHP